MFKYEKITEYAGKLAKNPGHWTKQKEEDGVIHLPMFLPSKQMQSFLDEFYSRDWLEGEDYLTILDEAGIVPSETRVSDLDFDSMDARLTLAVLTKAIRVDRFCEGALERAAKSGLLDSCLWRLVEIDVEDDHEARLSDEVVCLADEVLSAMVELPEGTELTVLGAIELTRAYQGVSKRGDETYFLYEGLTLSRFDSWELRFALGRRAERYGLFLDSSKWDNMVIGTPEVISFQVKHLS